MVLKHSSHAPPHPLIQGGFSSWRLSRLSSCCDPRGIFISRIILKKKSQFELGTKTYLEDNSIGAFSNFLDLVEILQSVTCLAWSHLSFENETSLKHNTGLYEKFMSFDLLVLEVSYVDIWSLLTKKRIIFRKRYLLWGLDKTSSNQMRYGYLTDLFTILSRYLNEWIS